MQITTLKASAKHILDLATNLAKCEYALDYTEEIAKSKPTCRRISIEGSGNVTHLQDCFTSDEISEIAEVMLPIIEKLTNKRRTELESFVISKEI